MATHNTRPRKASSTKKDASSTPSANTDATTRKKSFRNATHAAKSKDAAATEAVSGDDFLASAKALYRTQLKSLRELFSSTWNDDDLVSVLQEVQGDLDVAIARISEGESRASSSSLICFMKATPSIGRRKNRKRRKRTALQSAAARRRMPLHQRRMKPSAVAIDHSAEVC
jgi:hypothetical protein